MEKIKQVRNLEKLIIPTVPEGASFGNFLKRKLMSLLRKYIIYFITIIGRSKVLINICKVITIKYYQVKMLATEFFFSTLHCSVDWVAGSPAAGSSSDSLPGLSLTSAPGSLVGPLQA